MLYNKPMIVIAADTATRRWEVPDGLWRKVTLLSRIRLRRTVAEGILPLLGELEGLYLKDHPKMTPRLIGRTLEIVENDDLALEEGLRLFDLAVSEGLIVFAGTDGPVSSGTSTVGACGLTLSQARRVFLRRAAEVVLERSGRAAKVFRTYVGSWAVDDPRALQRLRLLMKLDPALLREFALGLGGNLILLLDVHEEYLRSLATCSPGNFLRPLRRVLKRDFPRVLEWSPSLLCAAAQSLDSDLKVSAMGHSLLRLHDPDKVRALGRWEVAERDVVAKDSRGHRVRRKKMVSHIREVKGQLGAEFDRLLSWSAKAIEQAGNWSDNEFGQLKPFLKYLDDKVMDTLLPLSVKQKVEVLDGLWTKGGREFMEKGLAEGGGVAALRSVVQAFEDMAARGSAPSNLKATIESGFFDSQLGHYLNHR